MSARKAARAARRPGRGRGRRGVGHDPLAGWPTGEHSPITPAGEYEQMGKLLSGLARQRGWRLVAARVVAVVFLLGIVALLLAGLLGSVHNH